MSDLVISTFVNNVVLLVIKQTHFVRSMFKTLVYIRISKGYFTFFNLFHESNKSSLIDVMN